MQNSQLFKVLGNQLIRNQGFEGWVGKVTTDYWVWWGGASKNPLLYIVSREECDRHFRKFKRTIQTEYMTYLVGWPWERLCHKTNKLESGWKYYVSSIYNLKNKERKTDLTFINTCGNTCKHQPINSSRWIYNLLLDVRIKPDHI